MLYAYDNWGIDPGKDGGVVCLPARTTQILIVRPVPVNDDGEWDRWMMAHIASQMVIGGARVTIEACHAFPGISAMANAEVMRAYGMWQGVLSRLLPNKILEVPAKTWKKKMGLSSTIPCDCGLEQFKALRKASGMPAAAPSYLRVAHEACKKKAYLERKARALSLARARFPGETFKTPRGRDLDGVAEAALIALYGREHGWPDA